MDLVHRLNFSPHEEIDFEGGYFPEMIFPIGKNTIGIRMQTSKLLEKDEEIDESYVYLFNAKDFKKPINRIRLPSDLNI